MTHFAKSGLLLPKPDRKREKRERQKLAQEKHEAWRDAVIERGRVGNAYQCHHCGEFFPREMICADHWPETKGSNPKRRYDPSNGVPSCQFCNTSGTPFRKKP